MNIFDDLISIDKNGNFSYNKWVEWNHFLIPNTQKTLRNFMRKLLAFFGHCKKCSALDGCYLLENNRPQQPLHINCECTRKTISLNQVRLKATAICPLIKFTDYIFKNKDKKIIYQSWGFTIEDSEKSQNI